MKEMMRVHSRLAFSKNTRTVLTYLGYADLIYWLSGTLAPTTLQSSSKIKVQLCWPETFCGVILYSETSAASQASIADMYTFSTICRDNAVAAVLFVFFRICVCESLYSGPQRGDQIQWSSALTHRARERLW